MTSEHSFKKWRIFHQRDEYMDLDDFLEDDEDDVLIRMQHDDGTTVTFLTAPPEVFTEREQLEPLLFGISETDICIVFNKLCAKQFFILSCKKIFSIFIKFT